MGHHLGPRLALLAEASADVGMGHLMEARALLAVAEAAGIRTRLVVNANAPLGPSGSGDDSVVRVGDLAPESLRAVASDLVGAECELIGDVTIEHIPQRAGDFGGKLVSSELAKRGLGWEPKVSFREGLRRYVEWYKEWEARRSADLERLDKELH